jgi:hypothetical protein
MQIWREPANMSLTYRSLRRSHAHKYEPHSLSLATELARSPVRMRGAAGAEDALGVAKLVQVRIVWSVVKAVLFAVVIIRAVLDA